MNKVRYEVTLVLHEDDNGTWGLCPKDSVGVFDAFWGADGVFHDVFEHYFEGQHRYFSGRYMHTIYGEMAASGAAIALSELGIDNFRYRNSSYSRDFTVDTWYILDEALQADDDRYEAYPIAKELCIVPRQKIPYSYNLSTWITEYEYKLMEVYESRTYLKRPVKLSSVRNTYAWGYKQAAKLVTDRKLSYYNLDEFLTQWHSITTADVKELRIDDEMAYPVRSFQFKVYDDFRTEVSVVDEVRNEYPLHSLVW